MPEPEFREEFGGLSVHFRKKAHVGAQSESSVELKGQVTPQVTPQVMEILALCEEPAGRNYIQEKLGLKDREHFRKIYLLPAIKAGLIEMTIPDKPKSRLQKYHVTEKGQRFMAEMLKDDKKDSKVT